MFHREDEPLVRLFLDDEQKRRLDRLWDEHRFISRQPVAENDYLPQFIGFVTQDQPKELLAFFEGQRPPFQKRAEEFEKEEEAADPEATRRAARLRRPGLPPAAAGEGEDRPARPVPDAPQEGRVARRGVPRRAGPGAGVAGVPVPHRAGPAGQGGRPGQRLGAGHAAQLLPVVVACPTTSCAGSPRPGKLRDPKVLAAQTQRMLKDDRVRALAIEFGTQWIHVRGFDELKEKNEKLFPTFDADLRKAIYEESILFFQDLFQSDRPVTQILDADYTFLNETLAKHYGIPGVDRAAVAAGRGRAEVRPRRHPGAGERAGQAVRGVADQPGPARQLGGRDAARREAAAAAGQRAAVCPRRKAATTS